MTQLSPLAEKLSSHSLHAGSMREDLAAEAASSTVTANSIADHEVETARQGDSSQYQPQTKDEAPTQVQASHLEPEDQHVQASEASEYITGFKLYAILLGLTMVVFLIMLDQTIVVTAIPKITDRFNSVKDIGWYGSAYMLSLASLQPLQGKIYTYYTSKKIFLTVLIIFEIGSLVCALAKSSTMLIIGRAVSGIGGSGLLIGCLTILAAAAPQDKRPLYLGIMMGIASLGLVLGPVLGGILTEHASWRWCFWLNLPIGGITATILGVQRVPDSKVSSNSPERLTVLAQLQRLDIPGFLLFTPMCVMLLLALEWGGVTYAWNSPVIIGLFCGAGGACVVFLLWERRAGEGAMVPLYMLKNRVIVAAALTTGFSQGSLILMTYYLPVWFQVVLGAGPLMGGVDFLPSVGAQVVASVVTGALTSRTGYPTPFAILGCAMTSIACGLLSTLTPSSNAGYWVGYQILLGISRGLTMQQAVSAIAAILPKEKLAVGNSLIMFCNVLGGAMFVSFGQTVFSNQLKVALRELAPDVDATTILAVGATAFRKVVSGAQLKEVVLAYNQALTRTYYLGAGASVASFAASWGMGLTNLKKKREETSGEVKA